MRDYAIGELSALSGVKVPTIRYYEEIGLLAAPPRTEGNQRRYDDGALSRLRYGLSDGLDQIHAAAGPASGRALWQPRRTGGRAADGGRGAHRQAQRSQ